MLRTVYMHVQGDAGLFGDRLVRPSMDAWPAGPDLDRSGEDDGRHACGQGRACCPDATKRSQRSMHVSMYVADWDLQCQSLMMITAAQEETQRERERDVRSWSMHLPAGSMCCVSDPCAARVRSHRGAGRAPGGQSLTLGPHRVGTMRRRLLVPVRELHTGQSPCTN